MHRPKIPQEYQTARTTRETCSARIRSRQRAQAGHQHTGASWAYFWVGSRTSRVDIEDHAAWMGRGRCREESRRPAEARPQPEVLWLVSASARLDHCWDWLSRALRSSLETYRWLRHRTKGWVGPLCHWGHLAFSRFSHEPDIRWRRPVLLKSHLWRWLSESHFWWPASPQSLIVYR